MKILVAAIILCFIAALINATVAAMTGNWGNTIAAVLLLFASGASYWQWQKSK